MCSTDKTSIYKPFPTSDGQRMSALELGPSGLDPSSTGAGCDEHELAPTNKVLVVLPSDHRSYARCQAT
jgi:hypothetical protein